MKIIQCGVLSSYQRLIFNTVCLFQNSIDDFCYFLIINHLILQLLSSHNNIIFLTYIVFSWLYIYNIPSSYVYTAEFQQYIITNNEVIEKLKQYSQNHEDPLNRYRATISLSYLYNTGKLDQSLLDYFRNYVETMPVDIGWNLVFSSVEPYFHLFESNIEEFQLLGAWMLAHISRTGFIASYVTHSFTVSNTSK